MSNPPRIAIYSRKSKFTGKGESIGNQIELCREYIRLQYGEQAAQAAVVFEDEGFTGGNLDRPGFQKMMQAVRQKQFDAILVYRLDRISRSVSDFSGLIEQLRHQEVDFISIKEQFDTSSPMGRAMMYISSVFSQLERETIAERIRDNMHELAKTGRWLGGNTPTGYASESVKAVTIDGKEKKACKLRLIPEEAELVRLVYDLFAQSKSLTKVDAELLRRGVATKNGNKFTRFSIKGILQNPVYAIADEDTWQYFHEKDADLYSDRGEFDGVHGLMAYNRTDQEKGRASKALPVSEWIVAVGQHPGLIHGKDWVAVQQALEQNRSKGYRRPRSNEALLTGLLYCRCGSRMYPKLTPRRTEDGERIYTYMCRLKERSKKSRCAQPNANGNLLDRAVVDEVKKLSGDAGFADKLEQSKKYYTGDRTAYDATLAELRAQRNELTRRINTLVDSLADLTAEPSADLRSARESLTRRIEEFSRELEACDGRIQEMEHLTEEHALSDIEFELLRQLLASFQAGMDDMSIEQRRAAVRTIVRKVIWDGRAAHVVLFGVEDGDVELPELPTEPADEQTEPLGPEDDDPDDLFTGFDSETDEMPGHTPSGETGKDSNVPRREDSK